jgi:O-methyltransferase involved in polyketide biosynthesis
VPSAGKVGVDLGGVAETVLWTTYQGSVEARRQDAVLDDPEVIALVDRIDYPFEQALWWPRFQSVAGTAGAMLRP